MLPPGEEGNRPFRHAAKNQHQARASANPDCRGCNAAAPHVRNPPIVSIERASVLVLAECPLPRSSRDAFAAAANGSSPPLLLDVVDGPILPFVCVSIHCGAARRTGHSLRPQNQMIGELTQCGTKGEFAAQVRTTAFR